MSVLLVLPSRTSQESIASDDLPRQETSGKSLWFSIRNTTIWKEANLKGKFKNSFKEVCFGQSEQCIYIHEPH